MNKFVSIDNNNKLNLNNIKKISKKQKNNIFLTLHKEDKEVDKNKDQWMYKNIKILTMLNIKIKEIILFKIVSNVNK
jgi:hypothetical protein